MLVASTAAAVGLLFGTTGRRTHLVQWGWDEPDTTYLRAHAPRMAQSPFDGTVFHASFVPVGGQAGGNLAWKAWGRQRIPAAGVYPAIKDLRATSFGTFRQNFLRVNVTPGDVDWFEDFEPVLANLRLASQVARAGDGVRGIVLDTEAYEAPVFWYGKQRLSGTRTFTAYAAQARRRGREVMAALRSSYPDLVLLVTFGHTLAAWESRYRGGAPLPSLQYGLLPAFMDGLVDGAEAGQVVDGYELSYAYREAAQFTAARHEMREGILPYVADPRRYRRVVRVGFGLWMDNDWRRHGWDPGDPSKNWFTPAAFESSLRAALAHTDGYVWVYTETPRLWTRDGRPESYPPAYLDALRAVRGSSRPAAQLPAEPQLQQP